MRYFKAVINEAWLLASPPQEVARFLEERSVKNRLDAFFQPDADKELELALLARNDPMITLAVARYGFYSEVSARIFSSATGDDLQSKALRYAVLSNKCEGELSIVFKPTALFGRREENVTSWLASAPVDEISVLFQNSSLSDSFVQGFLEGDGNWKAMDEERRMVAVDALSENKRMKAAYEGMMDGLAEYSHGLVFHAGWKLAESLPVSDAWAHLLCRLYERMRLEGFSSGEPLKIAKRWHPSPSNEEAIKKEKEELQRGYLSDYQGVRMGLGMLALSKSPDILEDLLASNDPALRCSAYRVGRLSPEQISAAYDKDGELFYNTASDNESLWQRHGTREALRSIAWEVVHKGDSDLLAANLYKSMKERMSKEHPEWFADEETPPEVDSGTMPATKDDISAAVRIMEESRQTLAHLAKRIGWIWWFSLGAVVGLLAKYL